VVMVVLWRGCMDGRAGGVTSNEETRRREDETTRKHQPSQELGKLARPRRGLEGKSTPGRNGGQGSALESAEHRTSTANATASCTPLRSSSTVVQLQVQAGYLNSCRPGHWQRATRLCLLSRLLTPGGPRNRAGDAQGYD
jgi:hypothetical protein